MGLLSTILLIGIHLRYNLKSFVTVARRIRIGMVLILLFLSYSYVFSFEDSRYDSKEFKEIAALTPLISLMHCFYKEKQRELLYAAHHKKWKPGAANEVDTTDFQVNIAALKQLHGITIADDSVDINRQELSRLLTVQVSQIAYNISGALGVRCDIGRDLSPLVAFPVATLHH